MDFQSELIGLIGLANKAGILIKGLENTIWQIKKKKIDLVLVTKDLGTSSKKEINKYCEENKVVQTEIGTLNSWIEELKIKNKVVGLKKNPLTTRIKNCLGV